jgi:hypothetical protein
MTRGRVTSVDQRPDPGRSVRVVSQAEVRPRTRVVKVTVTVNSAVLPASSSKREMGKPPASKPPGRTTTQIR